MKKLSFVLLVVFLVPFTISAQQRFFAALNGRQASGSNADGFCHIVLNAAQTQITVNCSFSSLTNNATAAHIHGAGAVGEVAPVLFTFAGVPSARSGLISSQTFDVTPQQVADMRAHRHYVDVHSGNTLPEIRGQIKQRHTISDFDGDGRTDINIFRGSTNELWVLNSIDGSVHREPSGLNHGFYLTGLWGLGGRVFVDFGDPIVWTLFLGIGGNGGTVIRPWGAAVENDSLVPADYDGDGNQEIAVFRRSTGDWWIMTDFISQTSYVEHWGTTNDMACVGDYDGDGKADLCAARAESGQRVWYIRNSSDGSMRREVYGLSNDAIFSYAVIDIDGDSKQDLALIRNVAGQRVHYIKRSSDGQSVQFAWGLLTDAYLFGDYDGDGKTDFVARRVENGLLIWYILQSSNGQARIVHWGVQGDG